MNVMEEIFEIRSSIEILATDIKVNTATGQLWVYDMSKLLEASVCGVNS